MPHRLSQQESHALAISAAGMGVWDWEIESDTLYWDPAIFDLYGASPSSFTGKSADWTALLHPDDVAPSWDYVRSFFASTALDKFQMQWRIIRPRDGMLRHIGCGGRLIRSPEGKPLRLVGVSWDRTDQVRMEREVARAYDFIEGIINSISDPIFVKDRDHRWVFFNNAFAEMVGTERENMLGKSDHDFFPKEIADHFWHVDDQVLNQRREIEVEEPVKSPAGETRFLLTKKSPIYDTDTDEQLLVGVIRDITERRKHEEELRNLQQLVESSNDLFAAFDLDCNSIYSNRAARELCGLGPRGRGIREVVPAQHTETLFGEACERAKLGGHWQGQLELLSLNDGPVPFSVSIFGIRGKDGAVTSLALIATDIRDQVKSQRLLLEQSKMAALGQLAGGIAHEINNPLAAVRGRLYLLRLALESSGRQPDSRTLLDEIQTVDRLTVRISEIVNALKVFSRKDSAARLTWLPLAELVREVVSVSTEKLRVCDAVLELKVSPGVLVHARRVDLMQILVNLINNSCDAVALQPERWVRVEARMERGYVLLSITDSGRGIPDEVVKRMMEPFFTTKEVGKGTGLGLSISRSLAENMGGTLEYDASSPNTRFMVRLAGREG